MFKAWTTNFPTRPFHKKPLRRPADAGLFSYLLASQIGINCLKSSLCIKKICVFKPSDPDKEPASNVVEWVRRSARDFPEHEAIVCGSNRYTWSEFDQRINQVANFLLGLGVGKGDRVAILAAMSPAYVEIFMGVLRAGACLVPLSPMATGDALTKMLNDSGSKVLFASEETEALLSDGLLHISADARVSIDFQKKHWQFYEQRLANSASIDPEIEIKLEDPFNIIYSSGTTGVPKGILHDHRMRAVQMERIELSGYGPTSRTLLSTPLYSNTTIVALLPTLVAGGTVVLMPKFDARGFLELCERERCTHTMLVPVQYKRIMDVPEFDSFDLSSMQMKFSTSAPLRADVKQDVLSRFPGGLTEYYGLTEGGGVTILAAHEYPNKLHTVGVPGPGVDLRFIDEQGQEVAAGESGEICGRSPTMMRGYYGRDDLTEEYLWFDESGNAFFRSGDMGRLDEDGFLILTDRKKDMIISGGHNIFANDLELALLQDEDVEDAAVIGVPSDQWGETPVGLVVLRSEARRTIEEICEAANTKLGKHQRISKVKVVDRLPRSSIGKILKRELRESYASFS